MRNKIRIVRCRNLEYRVCSGTEREISREDEEGRKKEGKKKGGGGKYIKPRGEATQRARLVMVCIRTSTRRESITRM